MKEIPGYLAVYIRSVNRYAFLLTSLLTATLIFLNYTVGIEKRIVALPTYGESFLGFFLLFAFIFSASWFIQLICQGKQVFPQKTLTVLLLAAPLIFAVKVTLDWLSTLVTQNIQQPWDKYWGIILNWPLKCLMVAVLVILLLRFLRFKRGESTGINRRGFNTIPYFILLGLMIPLVILAATRPDFLQTYPKMHRVDFIDAYVQFALPWKLLFELSYGLDFFTIEFFFRGFLVLTFLRIAGKDAILPMAAFYCAIHFGKPLFECITSYFGGLILGIIIYNTRSIWGGLIVHLGIAWLMEIAGYFGHVWRAA